MAWQGIPFPFHGAELTKLGLLIDKIPPLSVVTNSGFGWDSLAASALGAVIAAAIPGAIAWWSIKKNLETLISDRNIQLADLEKGRNTQLKIAEDSRNAQIISSNRLVWIKDLREATAEFVSTAYENVLLGQKVNKNGGIDAPPEVKEPLIASQVKLILHLTRVRMMLNPNKDEHHIALNLMQGIKEHNEKMVSRNREINADLINSYLEQFIINMQHLLKEDWDKAKKNM